MQGEDHFQCEICTGSFSHPAHLQSHITRVHGNAFEPETQPRSSLPLPEDDFAMCDEQQFEERSGTIPVNAEVFQFFSAFGDVHEPVYDGLPNLIPPITELNESCAIAIQSCTNRQQTMGEIQSEWKLIHALELRIPPEYRYVSSTFATALQFSTYVDRARKQKAKEEGWQKAIIKLDSGINSTGVFRSVLNLFYSEISLAGGLSQLRPFSEARRNGERIFSSPLDSDCMKKYEESKPSEGLIAGIDIYCDGTTLAKSGTQGATVVRARFVNISGRSTAWHEVGISPIIDQSTKTRTRAEIEKERLHLFHRYLFIALKDIIEASICGTVTDGKLVLPRIVTVVADQKQEGPFFSLKATGSFFDCSLCEMPSRIRTRTPKNNSNDMQPDSGSQTLRHESPGYEQYLSCPSGLSETALEASDRHRRDTELRHFQRRRTGANSRNVSKTVLCQVLVAKFNQNKSQGRTNAERRKIHESRQYLFSISAQEFPPALAAFSGLGSDPFHLYKSIGFDKLHVLDLGLYRTIPDNCFKRLSMYPYDGLPVSKQIYILNQRLLDLPRSSRLPKLSFFRSGFNKRQAGLSGKIRREFAPFLWVLFMGLSQKVCPDNDPLLQALLHLSKVQQLLLGINERPDIHFRTAEDILRIQEACFRAGVLLEDSMQTSLAKKAHRLMHHVQNHYFSFGCIRRGFTDSNEAMHKETKHAYLATNHRKLQLAQQLLSSRFAIEYGEVARESAPSSVETVACLLLTRNPVRDEQARLSVCDVPSSSMELERSLYFGQDVDRKIRALQVLEDQVQLSANSEDAESRASSIVHPSTRQTVWILVKEAQFIAEFDWWPGSAGGEYVSQTVYAGKSIYGVMNRRDAIEYRRENSNHLHKGVIQAIFKHKNISGGFKIALVRQLVQTEPEEGNRKVVAEFGHTRYRYKIDGSGDCVLDVVPVCNFNKIVVLVPDVWDISKRLGVHQRICQSQLPDTPEERRLSKFFEVSSYQFTSLPEAKI